MSAEDFWNAVAQERFTELVRVPLILIETQLMIPPD
jgi:hypothetical protein